jgi:hypothetical protein
MRCGPWRSALWLPKKIKVTLFIQDQTIESNRMGERATEVKDLTARPNLPIQMRK